MSAAPPRATGLDLESKTTSGSGSAVVPLLSRSDHLRRKVAVKDVVQRTFDWFGVEYEFARRHGDLYKALDVAIVVVDLQRSAYDRSYYVNIGFSLTAIRKDAFPRLDLCDITCRPDRSNGDTQSLHTLMRFENE